MKRGHATIWGELLECIVMQSRCHSTFTFQASERGRVLACLNSGLLRLAAGHMRGAAPWLLTPEPITLPNRRRIHHFLPRNSELLSPAGAGTSAGRKLPPPSRWEGEAGPEVDVPVCPPPRRAVASLPAVGCSTLASRKSPGMNHV